MNKLNRLFLALLLVVAAPLAFACDYPQKPDIPAGVTASTSSRARNSLLSFFIESSWWL